MPRPPRNLRDPEFRLAFMTVYRLDPAFLKEWAGLDDEQIFWAKRYCDVMLAVDSLKRTGPADAFAEINALAGRLFDRHDLALVSW